MKNNAEFNKGFLIAWFLFSLTALLILTMALSVIAVGKFVVNHNFDLTKYSGDLNYVADDVNDFYPYVIDTEGISHVFFEQEGAITHFLTDKHLPKDGSYLHVLEIKLYNSKTERLRLLRLVW